MLEQRSPWFRTRLFALVCAVLAAPLLFHQMRAEFEGERPTLGFVAAVFAFGVVGVLFVLALQAANPYASARWTKPTWSSPINWNQAIHVFHLNGWFFTVLGLSTAIYTLAIGSSNFLSVLPLAVGLGILLGVRLSPLVFRKQFDGTSDAA